MNKVFELYNDIIDLETDMILNPDDYDEKERKKNKRLIERTKKHLRKLGFIINEEGELVEV